MANLPTDIQQPAEMDITSIQQFVHFLTQWHKEKMERLQNLSFAKVGDEFFLGDDPTPVALTEEMRKGLLIGLTITELEMGVLPFHVEDKAAPRPTAEEVAQVVTKDLK